MAALSGDDYAILGVLAVYGEREADFIRQLTGLTDIIPLIFELKKKEYVLSRPKENWFMLPSSKRNLLYSINPKVLGI